MQGERRAVRRAFYDDNDCFVSNSAAEYDEVRANTINTTNNLPNKAVYKCQA